MASEKTVDEINCGVEVYCASLFAKCDSENVGRVRVSSMLKTLKDLQGVTTEELGELDKSSGEALLREIKELFDPLDEDREISLDVFTEGITSYLEKERRRLLLPESDTSAAAAGLNSHQTISLRWRTRSQTFDPENWNESSEAGEQLEEEKESVILVSSLKAKVLDLELQVRKLNEDNSNLRSNLNGAQEENFSLLQAQKEEQARYERETRSYKDRVRRLELSLQEKDASIFQYEDTNAKLLQANKKLECELSDLQAELKTRTKENEDLQAEVRKMVGLLGSRDEMILILKTEHESAEIEWVRKERDLGERIKSFSTILEDYEGQIENLKAENQELERKVCRLKTECEELKVQKSDHIGIIGPGSGLDDLPVTTSENIESELISTGENVAKLLISKAPRHAVVPKFDVATQCEENPPILKPVGGVSTKIILVVFLILLGLLISFNRLGDAGCFPGPYFSGVESYFASCGELSHDYVPII